MEGEALSLELVQLLVPFLMFGVNLVSQVLGCRYLAHLSLVKSVFFGYGIGLVCLLSVELFFLLKEVNEFPETLAVVATNFVIYSVFGYWYFIFITLLETAIRTRLLIELDKSKEGLSESEILAKYNVREIIEIRINRLVRNKQIINNGGKYYPGKSSLLLFGKFSDVMHRLVPGEKREA
jgi:hypothetical protein